MAISRTSPPVLATDNWYKVDRWWCKSCRWPCMTSQPVLRQVCSGSSETQHSLLCCPEKLGQSAAGKSQQLHPSLKVSGWNAGTWTFTWYFLVCHPDLGALGRLSTNRDWAWQGQVAPAVVLFVPWKCSSAHSETCQEVPSCACTCTQLNGLLDQGHEERLCWGGRREGQKIQD